MTDLRIRPFEDRDYPALVAVGNAVYTEYPWSVDEARHEDARYDGRRYVLRRFVAEQPDERIIAHSEYHHVTSMYHPRKFWINLIVHPEFQQHGLGSRLYDHLQAALAPHEPLVLWTGIRETFPHSLRFAERRGFREVRRAWESRLEVAGFDPAPFEARAADAVRGMAVTTVAEERERDPQYVAESFLFRSHQLPDVLYQGLTGTRRAYRGRGIALALKLRIVGYARERGYRAPMLHINLKLGFVRQPAWITFEKILG